MTGELLNSNGSATLTSVGNNVWTGDMTVASTLAVEITAGNSLAVDGNITGQYLNNYNYGGGQLILGGSANSIQYYVYNYGVLEVDGTLSTPSGYIYSYGTLRGTGTVNANTPSGYVYNYGTLSPGTASGARHPYCEQHLQRRQLQRPTQRRHGRNPVRPIGRDGNRYIRR